MFTVLLGLSCAMIPAFSKDTMNFLTYTKEKVPD